MPNAPPLGRCSGLLEGGRVQSSKGADEQSSRRTPGPKGPGVCYLERHYVEPQAANSPEITGSAGSHQPGSVPRRRGSHPDRHLGKSRHLGGRAGTALFLDSRAFLAGSACANGHQRQLGGPLQRRRLPDRRTSKGRTGYLCRQTGHRREGPGDGMLDHINERVGIARRGVLLGPNSGRDGSGGGT